MRNFFNNISLNNPNNSRNKRKNNKEKKKISAWAFIALAATSSDVIASNKDYCDSYSLNYWDWIATAMEELWLDYNDTEQRQKFLEENNINREWAFYHYQWRNIQPWDIFNEINCQETAEQYEVQPGEGIYSAMQEFGLDYFDEQQRENFIRYNNLTEQGWIYYKDDEPLHPGDILENPDTTSEEVTPSDDYTYESQWDCVTQTQTQEYTIEYWEWIYHAMDELELDYYNESQLQEFLDQNDVSEHNQKYYYQGRPLQPWDTFEWEKETTICQQTTEQYEVQPGEGIYSAMQEFGLDYYDVNQRENFMRHNNLTEQEWVYYKNDEPLYPGDILENPKKESKSITINWENYEVWEKIVFTTWDWEEFDAKILGTTSDWKIKVRTYSEHTINPAHIEEINRIKNQELLEKYWEWINNSIQNTIEYATSQRNPINVPENHSNELESRLKSMRVEFFQQQNESDARQVLSRIWTPLKERIDHPIRYNKGLVQAFDDVATLLRIDNARNYFENLSSEDFTSYIQEYWEYQVIQSLRLKNQQSPNSQSIEYIQNIDKIIQEQYEKHWWNLPKDFKLLMLGIIKLESQFIPFNIWHAGELGLTQIMPSNYREGGANYNSEFINPFNPEIAIGRSFQFLNDIYNRYSYLWERDYDLYEIVITSYNMWSGNVINNYGNTYSFNTNNYYDKVLEYTMELIDEHSHLAEFSSKIDSENLKQFIQ